MKVRITRFFSLCMIATLTLVLSYGVANACSDYITPSQGGSYSCELDHEGGGYCYYNCTCYTDQQTCYRNMHMDGFEIEGIDY